MQLVLNDAEKLQRFLGLGIVIRRQLVDIPDFLIKALFAGPDVPDPLQHLVKIIGTDIDTRLQAFIVHGKALDQILVQTLGGPAAELSAPDGIVRDSPRR